eukprot:184817-Pyramimonas_sp.AAC.1
MKSGERWGYVEGPASGPGTCRLTLWDSCQGSPWIRSRATIAWRLYTWRARCFQLSADSKHATLTGVGADKAGQVLEN